MLNVFVAQFPVQLHIYFLTSLRFNTPKFLTDLARGSKIFSTTTKRDLRFD
jgi:hypothetical protein